MPSLIDSLQFKHVIGRHKRVELPIPDASYQRTEKHIRLRLHKVHAVGLLCLRDFSAVDLFVADEGRYIMVSVNPDYLKSQLFARIQSEKSDYLIIRTTVTQMFSGSILPLTEGREWRELRICERTSTQTLLSVELHDSEEYSIPIADLGSRIEKE